MEKLHSGSNWMGALPQETKFWDLILPGTHNSHAYAVATPLIAGSALIRCQGATILEQLNMGIRCLDLRLGIFLDYEWYCYHWAATIPLKTALKDIKEFIDSQPTEVVIVKVKGDWDANDGKFRDIDVLRQQLAGYLEKFFGDRLVGSAFSIDTTIRNLATNGQQILLLYDENNPHQVGKAKLQVACSWSTTKTNNSHEIVTKCTNYAHGLRSKADRAKLATATLEEVSCHVTFGDGDRVGNFFGAILGQGGLYAEAEKTNIELKTQLKYSKSQLLQDLKKNVNVISVDYPDADLVKRIYYLNS